jgi:hypothetical protein
MAKNGYDQTYEDDRRENEETADLPNRVGRMVRDKVKEDLTGGAYVGSRLNMGNTPVPKGKIKATDNQTGEKYFMHEEGMKKGGAVKKFRHHDGIAQRGKTRA